MKHPMGLLAAMLWAFLAAVSPAQGQETLSEVSWGLSGRMFSIEDVEAFENVCGLSAEQRSAAQDVMLAGTERAAMVLSKSFREVRELNERLSLEGTESPEAQARHARLYHDSMRATMKSSAAIERETLIDLQAILTTRQIESCWSGFERYRRLTLLPLVQILPAEYQYAVRLESLIHASKLTSDDLKLAKIARTESEERLDTHMKALIEASKALQAEAQARSPEATLEADAQAASPAAARLTEVQKLIAAEYVRVCQRIAADLSADGRARFLRERVTRERLLWTVAGADPAYTMDSTLLHELRNVLTPEQKLAARGLREAVLEEMYRAMIPDLDTRDQAVTSNQAWTVDPKRREANAKLLHRLTTRFRQDVMALLSDEQRQQLEMPQLAPAAVRANFFRRDGDESTETSERQ